MAFGRGCRTLHFARMGGEAMIHGTLEPPLQDTLAKESNRILHVTD